MGGRKRGQVIIMFVLALFVLVGFVALGIDVGYMYSVRNDLQRSVDSGALAGAFAFHDGGWTSTSNPVFVQDLKDKAEARATFFATRDPVGAAPLPNGAITFAYPPGEVNQIQVTAQTNVNLFFAGVIGTPTVMLSATATAEAIPVDQNVECLTPLAFPYPYDDANNDNTYNPGETVYDFCNPASPLNTLCQGGRIRRAIADTDNSPSDDDWDDFKGQIFPLLICNDSSDSEYRDRLRDPCGEPCPNPVSILQPVAMKDDPTWDANTIPDSNTIIGWDSTGDWNIPTKLPVSTHANYSGDNWLLSPRVMRVMLYDPRDSQPSGFVRVTGLAGFWIESTESYPSIGFLNGYLVPDSAVGGPSASPPIAPSLKTTRLVQ